MELCRPPSGRAPARGEECRLSQGGAHTRCRGKRSHRSRRRRSTTAAWLSGNASARSYERGSTSRPLRVATMRSLSSHPAPTARRSAACSEHAQSERDRPTVLRSRGAEAVDLRPGPRHRVLVLGRLRDRAGQPDARGRRPGIRPSSTASDNAARNTVRQICTLRLDSCPPPASASIHRATSSRSSVASGMSPKPFSMWGIAHAYCCWAFSVMSVRAPRSGVRASSPCRARSSGRRLSSTEPRLGRIVGTGTSRVVEDGAYPSPCRCRRRQRPTCRAACGPVRRLSDRYIADTSTVRSDRRRHIMPGRSGRDGGIRTRDPLLPKQVR